MAKTVRLDDVCDLAWIARVTGINPRTLSVWANRRGKIPRLDTPRLGYGGLYSWRVVRPLLVEQAQGLETCVDPAEWPE